MVKDNVHSARSCLRLYRQGFFSFECFPALLINQSLDGWFIVCYFSTLGLNEVVKIEGYLLYFCSDFAHQFLNGASFVFGTVIWEPVDFELIDLSGDAVLEASVIARIFHLHNVSIEDIVPQEVFIGMLLEGSSLFLHLYKIQNTSGLVMEQI